ncbi:hypothetical protein C8R43DRAFT_1081975 [Mycena crocata]|nr:hypothetical protein C8R43DRAFT_1081975 [Mycena crocata]
MHPTPNSGSHSDAASLLASTSIPLPASPSNTVVPTPAAPISPTPGMRTIPCSGLDLRPRYLVITHGLIINGQLEPTILKETLSELIRQKFPRAGARIAQRNGMYEFQIPHTFSEETPPVAFTVEEYAEQYRSPARPDLPHDLPDGLVVSQPSIHPRPPALSAYFRSSQCPTTFDQFLVPNTPALHVHVAVFTNLTFIGFTSSHILLDSLGRRTLLHAWTRLLNGESIDNIIGMAWDAAPFEAFVTPLAVGPRDSWVTDVSGPHPSQNISSITESGLARKLVRVPKTFLADTTREINADLKVRGSSEWVGSSDVLLAWWLKTVYGNRSGTTSIDILYPVNLRDRPIFPGTKTISAPYINNAYVGVPIPLISINALRTEPVAEIALIIRRAIIAFNADPAGLAADVQWRCSNPLACPAPPPTGIEYTAQTNCRKSQFGMLDFSGACVGSGDKSESLSRSHQSESRRRGMPCFVDVEIMNAAVAVPTGVVMAEDEDAVWMSQIRRVEDWESIHQSGTVAFV